MNITYIKATTSGGGVGETPILPSGNWHVPFENYYTPVNRAITANFFIGGICMFPYDLLGITDSRIWVGTGAVGNGLVGVYEFDAKNNKWDLLDYTIPFDSNITSVQEVGFNNPIDIKAYKYYAFGMNVSAAVSVYSMSTSALRSWFGYGGSMVSSHNSCLQFAHSYDGTLPSTINPPQYGAGTSAFIPTINIR